MSGAIIIQPGGGGGAGEPGAPGAPGSVAPYMPTPYYSADRPYAIGDMVRWGNGLYKALKAMAAGASSQPGVSAPGLGAARKSPLLDILKDPMTRAYVPGMPKSDINNDSTYSFRVATTAACVLSITNRADNPVNRTLNVVIYDNADNFQGVLSPNDIARGATGTFNLGTGNYNVCLTAGGYVAFDASVNDPTKVTGPDWETIIPGAPPTVVWRSADVAVGSGHMVVCDQWETNGAGAYNNGDGRWTCPAGGLWRIETYLHLTGLTAGVKSYSWIESVNGGSYQALFYNADIKRIAQGAADASGDCILQGSVTVRAVRGQQWRPRIEPGAGSPVLSGGGVHYQEPSPTAARFKATFEAPIW